MSAKPHLILPSNLVSVDEPPNIFSAIVCFPTIPAIPAVPAVQKGRRRADVMAMVKAPK
jgi:hypothetical protein